MTRYSIVRKGDDYVVRAGDQDILKVASRRRAAQLVTDAAELLDSLQSSVSLQPTAADVEPSTADISEVS
ncbi:MAG TPA: hypothetical protein VKT76_15095 [Bradyrhizobium sp.]|nr:hypothetical protein [Bradyrhizobium sp.]